MSTCGWCTGRRAGRRWPRRGKAFLAAQRDGLARAVGVSNFSTTQIDDLEKETGETPAVNQIPWSPWEHHPERLAETMARGVVVEGYSPLARSRLRDPVLTEIAAAHDVTPAQVVLRWHLEHDIVVIPKSAQPERITSNLDIFGFTLTADEITRIDALSGSRRR